MKNKVISLFGNNKIAQNHEVKYSALLEQFMTPFAKELEKLEYYDNIIEFSINAWNFGNMKQFLPDNKKIDFADYLQEDDIGNQLLAKMIEYKISNFKEYTNFIVDYELTETDEYPVLSLITQERDTYIANMLDNFEEEDLQDEYEENFINRSAIIIKPLQPFIDWLNALYPENKYDESDITEPAVYLVDENIEDLDKWIKKKFDKFFTMKLENWHTNKKEWPQKRNYKMFTQWFQVLVSELVFDTEKEPVLKIGIRK